MARAGESQGWSASVAWERRVVATRRTGTTVTAAPGGASEGVGLRRSLGKVTSPPSFERESPVSSIRVHPRRPLVPSPERLPG